MTSKDARPRSTIKETKRRKPLKHSDDSASRERCITKTIYNNGKFTKMTVFINGQYRMGIGVDKGNRIGVTQRKVSPSHGDDDLVLDVFRTYIPGFTAFTLHRAESQSHTLDQSRCVCGHGIHAHADYLSLVVHHCPTKYYVAYVQKTPKTQECSCGALLVDHVPVFNTHRSPAAQEPLVGDAHAIGASSYTTNTSASSNVANLTLFASPPPSSLDIQLGPVAQTEADAVVAHDLGSYALDDGVPNGTIDYQLNAVYNATPESGAWAWSDGVANDYHLLGSCLSSLF
ncbi:uncharacterized protein ARMOST_07919 [Armillaria ostoyae]|uniref:Uncharacterized protein n=1 Tax=Armillaria ostoyae TaxID=47428 RepID=A0A284R778_ARMOS|nr:uncharacterized protein ARMOST_07919 [Armillaria ostoyae]